MNSIFPDLYSKNLAPIDPEMLTFRGNINISPPTEYPKNFSIEFVRRKYRDNVISDRRLYARYTEFISKYDKINTNSLDKVIENLRVDYNQFLDNVGRFRHSFAPENIIDKILKDIIFRAEEGDIILFGNYAKKYYYVYGKENNRKISIIKYLDSPNGKVLPKESLNTLTYYNIHELKDINKYYPYMDFKWIEIPYKYFPPQLSDVDKESLVFLINNEYGINEEYYKNVPIIPLDIGNYERYIIYVSIPLRSRYLEDFMRKPEYKI